MRHYFDTGTRKAGIGMLVVACLFMAAWMRSRTYADHVVFNQSSAVHELSSYRGVVMWEARKVTWHPVHWRDRIHWWSSRIDFAEDDEITWKPLHRWEYQGFSFSSNSLRIAYRSIAIPLAIFSIWLLFSEPRRVSHQTSPD